MDNAAQFVSYLNVTRFLDKLQFEYNPVIQLSLQTLLLEEVEKSGLNLKRLDMVQRHIVEGIALQKALIGGLAADGRDVSSLPMIV
jgi:hypothetical protein